MLVLARKMGQSILIGSDIKIFVAEISGDRVKLSIEAPPHLEIYREEIYMQIKEENTRAIANPEALKMLLKQGVAKKNDDVGKKT